MEDDGDDDEEAKEDELDPETDDDDHLAPIAGGGRLCTCESAAAWVLLAREIRDCSSCD